MEWHWRQYVLNTICALPPASCAAAVVYIIAMTNEAKVIDLII